MGERTKKRFRWRALVVCGLAFLVLLVLGGFIFQTIGASLDARAYPPPGKMVDVGGYKLHLYSTGEGVPTVVLDSGHGAPALIWMADARQRCTYVNRGWTEFTGIDVEDDPSRCRDGAIHPDDRTAWAEAIAAAYRERKPFSVEYRVRRDDGEYRWLLDAGTPLLAADGAPILVTDSREAATANAWEHDLRMVSLH